MDERFARFQAIKTAYDQLDRDGLRHGKLPMGETSHGFWGTTNMNDAYTFFSRINLEKSTHFIDLGCGDGRVVLIASLFTKATGIEGDTSLFEKGRKIQKELGLANATLKEKNYYEEELSPYDIIFMFPDKKYDEKIIEKLKKEFKGVLYIYNKVYLPEELKKGTTHWIDQMPIASYVVNRN